MNAPPPPPKKSRTGLIIGLVIGGIVVLGAAAVAIWLIFFRNRGTTPTNPGTNPGTGGTTSCTLDSQCSAGRFCISGSCALSPSSCTSSAQCGTGGGRYCSTITNSCQAACTTDAQCTTLNAMATCNTSTGQCQMPSGGGCVSNTDCASNETCSGGVCVTVTVGLDQNCSASPCLSGLTCYQNFCRNTCTITADCTGGRVCQSGACVPSNLQGVGGVCTTTSECQSGLNCTNGGTCQNPTTACTNLTECAQGLVCTANTCVAPNGGLGTACAGLGQGSCNSGFVCTNGSCQLPVTAGLGQSCVSTPCSDGLFCNQEGVCGNGFGVANGNACSSSTQCNFGSYCNSAGVCTAGAPRPSGTACSSYGGTDCNFLLQCINTTGSLTCQATTAVPFCAGGTLVTVGAQVQGTSTGSRYRTTFGTAIPSSKPAFLMCAAQPGSQTSITQPLYAFIDGDTELEFRNTRFSETSNPPDVGMVNLVAPGVPRGFAYNAPTNVILSDGTVVPLVKLNEYRTDIGGNSSHVALPKNDAQFTISGGSQYSLQASNFPNSYVVKLDDFP